MRAPIFDRPEEAAALGLSPAEYVSKSRETMAALVKDVADQFEMTALAFDEAHFERIAAALLALVDAIADGKPLVARSLQDLATENAAPPPIPERH